MKAIQANYDWSVEALSALPDAQLLSMTRLAVGSMALSRLYLGRCMLAEETRHLAWRTGYSSAIHLAVSLGVRARTAREARRVAFALEYLPLLRRAAESGSVPWTSLRAIVSKASDETEAQWLELCGKLSPDAIEKLAARTQEGEAPLLEPEPGALPLLVRLVLEWRPEENELLQKLVQAYSLEAERRVGVQEALLWLVAEKCAGPDFRESGVWEQLLVEARATLDARAEVVEREIAFPETPYAVLAAEEVPVPGDAVLQMVRPLRFSGTARVVTPAQRAFLLRRDGYGCVTPGCSNRIWLHVHHIAYYCNGGVTLPCNLVMLCSRCHKNVHEGWLRVAGEAPGGLRFSDSGGRGLMGWDLEGRLLVDPDGSLLRPEADTPAGRFGCERWAKPGVVRTGIAGQAPCARGKLGAAPPDCGLASPELPELLLGREVEAQLGRR